MLDGIDYGLVLTILAIVGLLAMSGFFSGSETALTAASDARMHQLENEGHQGAALVNQIRHRKDRLIGALLLGNNLVNILASALATSALISLFGDGGVVVATVVMTLLVLIFSEVLPKTYALAHADKFSLAVAPIIRWIVLALSPATQAVGVVVTTILRALGSQIEQVSVGIDLDELRGAIEMHRSASEEREEEEVRHERAMLRSVLELSDVDVSEVMTHRRNVRMLDAGLQPLEALDIVLNSSHSRMPVFRDEPDNIIGVLHVKQLLREVRARGGQIDRLDVLSVASDPWFVPDTTTLLEQLLAFRSRHEHFAVVVDEYGSLMGIVTLEDILEEIVGDINDEHDVRVAGVRPQPNGTFIVDGTVTLRDLNREFEWGLPDEEATTIAGLILHEAKRIPDVNQSFSYYGFRFDIMRRHRNQITQIRILPNREKRARLTQTGS